MEVATFCLFQVQDKFRLDLSDEEAVHYMQSLIDESVGALFAAVVEQIHKFAQVRSLTLQKKAFAAIRSELMFPSKSDLSPLQYWRR